MNTFEVDRVVNIVKKANELNELLYTNERDLIAELIEIFEAKLHEHNKNIKHVEDLTDYELKKFYMTAKQFIRYSVTKNKAILKLVNKTGFSDDLINMYVLFRRENHYIDSRRRAITQDEKIKRGMQNSYFELLKNSIISEFLEKNKKALTLHS